LKAKKLSAVVFREQEQITKNYSKDLLTELIKYQGENLEGEIIRLGIQQLMELDRVFKFQYNWTDFPLKLIALSLKNNNKQKFPQFVDFL